MGNQNVAVPNLPDEVLDCTRFLQSRSVWYILSENPKVISCGNAAANRERLGNRGIPIFDELKSELGFFINKENKKQKVLIHCRGNQKLDRLKISGILNAEYQRITNAKGIKGLINPFGKKFRNLLQIFDRSTIENFHPPNTMMTNAGDFCYAIEFEVNLLVCSLKNVLIEDIVRVDNYYSYKRHKIGILTGNGPDSGILLWKKINESVKMQLKSRLNGDLSYPEIVVNSVPDMGISMELDKRLFQTEKIVIKSTIDLCRNGISLLCIACNTTQYYKKQIEDICDLYHVKFISIPDVVRDYLIEKNINAFDFIGISYVADFKKFSAFKDLQNEYTISLPNIDVLSKIKDIAFIVKNGNIDKGANLLRNLIKKETAFDTVIIALTEISAILSEHPKLVRDKTVIDSLQLLADYVAKIYANGIFDTFYVDKSKDFMEIVLLSKEDKEKAKQELWNIVCEINDEFFPPLSYRTSTTEQFSLNNGEINKPKKSKAGQPTEYFKTLMDQEIIVCKKKSQNQIIGFMSFIPNFNLKIKRKNFICHYITTIGVTKGERGNGITNQFYKKIEEIAKMQDVSIIATRTWSTNKTHLKILSELKFASYTIKNDRGTGINTLYLVKQMDIDKKALYRQKCSVSETEFMADITTSIENNLNDSG